MAHDTGAVLAQIDDLLTEFARARDAAKYDDFSGGLPEHELIAIATRFRAAIRRLSTADSEYSQRAIEITNSTPAHAVRDLGGVLHALRADVEAGYIQTLTELVHADVFSDFLDMATELHRNGYKDASAVIAGSTLEEHLRKLAARHGVAVTKPDGKPVKADTLNADLTKAGVYNALVQKQVTAWLDLRNKAAHGKYGEYDDAQVAAFIRDVLDFMAKYSA